VAKAHVPESVNDAFMRQNAVGDHKILKLLV
jgi:hypothetical protein